MKKVFWLLLICCFSCQNLGESKKKKPLESPFDFGDTVMIEIIFTDTIEVDSVLRNNKINARGVIFLNPEKGELIF